MVELGGTRAVRVLLVSVLLVFSAGALSAAVVDSPASTSQAFGESAGGPAVTQPSAPADATTSTTAGLTTTSPPTTVRATTTTRRPTTATTTKAVTAPTTRPTRPTRPTIQAIPITPTLPNLVPATSWQADKNGVSIRVRIEPTAPIAGQPVRFVIDVSSAQPCCIILVGFGEGSVGASNLGEVCSGNEVLDPGQTTFETTHTYAAPGAYRAMISADDGPCPQTAPPGGRVGTPDVIIDACFAVGPGTAGQAGCRPGFAAP